MKKSMFLVALAAVSLASCSHDEVVELKTNEIKFTVVNDNVSRANILCNNNPIPSFNLYATAQGADTEDFLTYINGDAYTVTGGVATNDENTRYWPSKKVNFYATYNHTAAVVLNGNNAPTMDFTVADVVADQTDLVYAAKLGMQRDNANKEAEIVPLNFRHALSQIVFQAKNINKNLYIVIKGVKVGKVAKAGTLTFPTKSTDTNIDNHDQDGMQTTYQGTWNATGALTDYTVNLPSSISLKAVAASDPATNLTNANAGVFTNDLAMMLLPTQNITFQDGSETVASKALVSGQAAQAWVPTDGDTDYNGTYLAVDCEIYNIANPDASDPQGGYDSSSDIQLYNKLAVIPAKFEWEQGKKYVYTFVFGDGNGGYEPIDPTDPNPDPVLVPMTFKVTVDDFQKGTADPIENEMKTN